MLQGRTILADTGWWCGSRSTPGKDWERSNRMFAASEGSRLQQHRSEGVDSVDDEFTPEELR